MKSSFQTPPRSAIALLAATGLTLFTLSPSFSAPAENSSNPSTPTTPTSPTSPTSPITPSSSPPSQTSKQPDDPMKRDRVSIDEVFPEYCRMYFPSRGTVSMFEYRERMHLCLYGPDRGFF